MPLHRLAQRHRRSRDLATFEQVINAAGLILWSAGVDGRCTYMSEYWTQLTGHPLRAVIGDGWLQFVEPDDVNRIMPAFYAVLERREPLTIEYRLRRADGTLFWVRDHGQPVFEKNQFKGYVGTILEIDDRKRLEEDLREANERYDLAVRGTNDGLWDWDLVTGVGFVTERSQEILGYSLAELSTFARFLEHVHPDDRARMNANIENHWRHREPHDIEYRWRMPNGRYRWMHSRGQAIWDESGRPIRMAGSTGDITDRKRAERKVELLNQRLTASNTALQRQSGLLEALAQRLIEVGEQERSRVARELHDDLIQNLAYLQMRVAVLAQATPALRPELVELEKLTERIANDVRRVARDLHSTVLDHLGLERALRSYCADFAATNSLAIKVRRHGSIGQPPAAAALCLYRVAQESLRNAARHSGARAVAVTLSGPKSGAPRSVTLRVEDKGRGFEPTSMGSGLGLTSMSERVRLAGGTFRLNTRPGHGTLVEATIPWQP